MKTHERQAPLSTSARVFTLLTRNRMKLPCSICSVTRLRGGWASCYIRGPRGEPRRPELQTART